MTVQNYLSKGAILFLFVCMFALSAFATELNIVDTINEDLSVQETIIIISNSSVSIPITLPQDARQIMLDQENANRSFALETCQGCIHNISYTLPKVVAKTAKQYKFARSLSFPGDPASLKYVVIVPIGYILNLDQNAVVPTPTTITTDGKNTKIEWTLENPVLPLAFQITYYDHEATESALQELINELTETYVYFGIIIAFIIGVAVGFLASKRTHKARVLIPDSVLSPDERKVTHLLLAGTVNQKEIGAKLQWSKSKVSAVVTQLEYKHIISREKFGRNYTVTLEKRIDDTKKE